MAKLFYQNGNLITLKNHGYYQSVFRTNNHIVAQSSTDSTQQLELFAIDTKNSILCAHDSLAREEHAYTAFGHSAKLPSTRTLQGFNGEFLNKLLGAYQLGLGFRTFSPGLMRFQSPDNLSPFGKGGFNCYAYCSGDPVNYTDPTGHALVHLKNGQTMSVAKNAAVALHHKFKPSTLKRTTSHASALRPTSRRNAATPESANHFMKIAELDVIENIIGNLSFKDTIAFSNSSPTAYGHARPIINKYIKKIFVNDETIRAASGGGLPGVPSTFSQTIGLPRAEYLNDVNRIQSLGGPENFLRLIRHGREHDRRNALRARHDRMDDLIFDAD